jgi:hypothetical protein
MKQLNHFKPVCDPTIPTYASVLTGTSEIFPSSWALTFVVPVSEEAAGLVIIDISLHLTNFLSF